MKTDIEIAQSCPLLPITAIGAKLGLTEEQLECYGRYKAKLLPSATAVAVLVICFAVAAS